MVRRLMTFSAFLSALLFIVTLTAAGITYFRADRLRIERCWRSGCLGERQDNIVLCTVSGRIMMRREDAYMFNWNRNLRPEVDTNWDSESPWSPEKWFLWQRRTESTTHGETKTTMLVFPLDALPVCCAFLSVVSIRSTIKRRRQFIRTRSNLCQKCGYDLRATPARCPECGTPVLGAHTEQ